VAKAQNQGDRKPPDDEAIPITHFDSWNSFKAEFTEVLFGDNRYQRDRFLFRGHSDKDWHLEPTFDRRFQNADVVARLDISTDLIEQFKRALQVTDHDDPDLFEDTHRLLALGQHYGLPTRLLDWTESPYVAAFFAFNSAELFGIHDQQVAIWALDSENRIWSREYGVEIIDVSWSGNDRIRNQSGKFTWSKTPFSNLEDYVREILKLDVPGIREHPPLRRFLVPADDSAVAMADLDAMGIHHANVYPELEGAAQMALFRTVERHGTRLSGQLSRPT
jgi:hypothetical protein